MFKKMQVEIFAVNKPVPSEKKTDLRTFHAKSS